MHRRGRTSTKVPGEVLDMLNEHLHHSASEKHDHHGHAEQNYRDIVPAHMPLTISPIRAPVRGRQVIYQSYPEVGRIS